MKNFEILLAISAFILNCFTAEATDTTNTIAVTSTTVTGFLSQEMSGCEIANSDELGFGNSPSRYSISDVYITTFYFKPEDSGIYIFSFPSTDYDPELLVGSFGFDCCSKNDGQALGDSYSSADSTEFYLEAGVYYPMKVTGTGGRPSLEASKDGEAISISDFQWYTNNNMDSAECSSVSAVPLPTSSTSSSTTSTTPTPTGLLSQEMSGCEISNSDELGFGNSPSRYSISDVYITTFYFKPEDSGIYIFSFPSTDYDPELLSSILKQAYIIR
ncbi:hypothetical protein B5S29_g4319 [[Candida] boidinii]|nr:hypothetical protein B5S29_g4319 [[Candida] boidinii]